MSNLKSMKKTVLTFLFITTIFAQDVVSIVTSGDGSTKDQATTAALRNAIEQAYGAFISSNTKFLNDELIQDEIVSLSQGTITEYSIISSIETKNGYNVTTKSTVSLGKLTSFVESKGGSITINGSSFYRNLLIEDFYNESEHKPIESFIDTRLKNVQVWDYDLISQEPYRDGDKIAYNAYVGLKPNKNLITFFEDLEKLLKSISINEQTANFRENSNLDVYAIKIYSVNSIKTYLLRSEKSFQEIKDLESKLSLEAQFFELRGKLSNDPSVFLEKGYSFDIVINNWNMIYAEHYGCTWMENYGGAKRVRSNTIRINPFVLFPNFNGTLSAPATCYNSKRDKDINNRFIGTYVLLFSKKIILSDNVIRNLNEIFIKAF